MTDSPLPTFFILGAGRCGTTSLADHLRRHSDVFIPDLKEPSFFSPSYQYIDDPGEYVDLYRPGRTERALGDASHIYLEDPDSPEILEAFFPDARFILIFRNPADRAIALYAWMVASGYEVHPTFERALAAETRRFNSGWFRRNCRQSFWNYMYFRSGRFGEQVARYLDLWPRERFYATTLYEYAARPERVTNEIVDFLGLRSEDLGAVPRSNPSTGTRSIAAQLVVRRVLKPLSDRGVPFSAAAWHRVNGWNRRGAERPRIRPETRAELMERYRPDLDYLRSLLGIDVEASEREALASSHRTADPGDGISAGEMSGP
jgi:hypothetical protein